MLPGRPLRADGRRLGEVPLRVVERVLHRLEHQVAQRGLGNPQRLVVPLAVDRVDDAGQVPLVEEEEVGQTRRRNEATDSRRRPTVLPTPPPPPLEFSL